MANQIWSAKGLEIDAMKRVLVLTAVGEAATGVALLVVPSLVGQLLFGAALTGIAMTVARVTGLALIALGVACWPGTPAERLVIGFGAGASELRTAVEGYQITPQGPRKLGSGTVDSGGSKSPGAVLGVAGLAATGNPAGLIISTGIKVYGEESGKSTVEGRAQQTAKEIADVLKQRFQQQGWIS
jgi:hypothetical protein